MGRSRGKSQIVIGKRNKMRDFGYTDPAESHAASYHPNMADQIDTLEDRVRERLILAGVATLGLDALARITASVVEETIQIDGDTEIIQRKRDDTLEEALLAHAANRSPISLTAIAKRYINPLTKKNYTRAAISARLRALTERTGLFLRAQRSDKVVEAYRERAYRVHEKRRKDCPKWDAKAFFKGIKRKK